MVEWLLTPLQYGFVLRGLAAGALAAVACAGLSAFVVWRGMAFAGDALAHSILPGIVVAYVLGFSLFLGALAAAIVAVLGVGLITRRGSLREDTAIGVMFVGLFALGILLLSRVATMQDLSHILFGNILGVSRQDLFLMLAIVVLVLLVLGLFYKELLVTSFDPTHAVAIGLSPGLMRYGLLAALAVTTVVGVQSVGVVLVLALLVTPGAAASQISRRLGAIIGISIGIALGSTFLGFYASYYLDVASGPAIVLALTAVFIIAWIAGRIAHVRGPKRASEPSAEATRSRARQHSE